MLSSAKFFSILFLIFLLTMVILRYSRLSSIEIKILIIVFLFPTTLLASTIYEIKNKKVSLFFNFLGNISYSTYLLHFPVQIIILSFLKHLKIQIDFGSQQFFLSYIFFIIVLSSLSYIFYENKIKIYIRKKI